MLLMIDNYDSVTDCRRAEGMKRPLAEQICNSLR
jgi:hypothetical protein